ncbi:MAG: DEAD/DEAH box helicase [Sulfolobales archaeon]
MTQDSSISDVSGTSDYCLDYQYIQARDSLHELDAVEKQSILSSEIIRLLREKGWEHVTDLQLKSFQYILRNYNVLITAPTGSGKTEAALLPILSAMLSERLNDDRVYVLYITPMRALINDLYKRISWWSSKLGFTVSRKHGDVSRTERIRRLKKIPHILIITPESLQIDLDWSIRFREYYQDIRYIIIDEVHELMNSKRGVQLAVLLERLKKLSGKDPQIILLSATIGDPCYVLRFFTYSSERPGVIISSRDIKKIHLDIEYVDNRSGLSRIAEVIKNHYEPTTIVFVNSRYMAEKIHEELEKIGITDTYVHHSSISSKIKEDVENKIKFGRANIVVSTRTLELGVDLRHVKKIIMYRSPGQVTSFIQRIGRSGHGLGEISKGTVIIDNDIDLIEIAAITKLLEEGYIESVKRFEKPLDVVARTIQGFAMRRNLVDIEEIYETLKRVYVFRDLSFEEFMNVVDELNKNNIIERYSDNSIKLSGRFYNIWSFENKPGSKSFTEFFTYISDTDIYQVKSNNEIIGALDDVFVYRFLRAGDVIRLSGKLWKILKIDDINRIIEVSPTEDSEGLIPIWNSEIVNRSHMLALKFYEILSKGIDLRNKIISCNNLDKVYNVLSRLREWFSRNKVPVPDKYNLVLEKVNNEYVILYPFGDRLAEIIGYVLLNEAISRSGRNVGVRISAYGISLVGADADPVELLVNVARENRVEEAIRKAIARSPRLRAKIREIQFSFGKSHVAENDEFIINEAIKQIIDELRDIYSPEEFIRDLYRRRIKIHKIKSREPSPIADRILSTPITKIWLRDVSYTIYKTLKNMALTAQEIAEIAELPLDLVESKLKEMKRDPELTVIQFRDVTSNETRWVLLEDIEEIIKDPLFSESFEPLDQDELFEIAVKNDSSSPHTKIIIRARDIVANGIGKIESLIRGDEVYELKVSSVENNFSGRNSVSYYNIRREAVKYVILNSIAYLQRINT